MIHFITNVNRRKLAWWAALTLASFQVVVPNFITLLDIELRAIHVMLGLTTALFLFTVKKAVDSKTRIPLWDWFILGIVLVATLNILFQGWNIYLSLKEPTIRDLVLGGLLIVVVLDLARRATGWGIPACCLIMFVYIAFGHNLPGLWWLPSLPIERVIQWVYFSPVGLFGSITGYSATFIGMFIIFGAFLQGTGAAKVMIDAAIILCGRFTGGPAKVSIISSAMFGSISGSAVANVAVTGAYTIPTMKRLGYKPDFAGAVESIASTGGIITPPIMGIAAFMMAEFLNIPYITIVYYALIPCIIYYVGLFASVHFEAKKLGLMGIPKEERPSWRSVLKWQKMGTLIVPMAVLVYMLLERYPLLTAAFYASASLFVLYVFSDFSLSGIGKRLGQIPGIISTAGTELAQIVPLLVCVSMLVNLFGITGLAPKVATLITEVGGGTVLGALIIAAIVNLILGAPLPVPATYIICFALVQPSLLSLGLDVIAVNMFTIYFAALGSLTPPTCTACIVAAAYAGGHWLKVCYYAIRLGIVAFLLPFFFVLNTALIGRGSAIDVLQSLFSGLAGAFLIAHGIFGYHKGRAKIFTIALTIACGILLLAPSWQIHLAVIIAVTIVLSGQRLMQKIKREALASASH